MPPCPAHPCRRKSPRMPKVRIRPHVLTATLIVFFIPTGRAQAPAITEAKPLAFDAITIKPNSASSGVIGQLASGEAVIGSRSMFRNTPDGINATNVTTKSLITSAYGIKENQISGAPDWVGSAHYDVQAKVTSFDPPDVHQLTKDQRNQMLQSLLVDRFKLLVHNETKDAPIYELNLAKSGPKLHEATPGDTYPNGPKGPDGISRPGMVMMSGPGDMTFQAIPISNLVDMLSHLLGRTVVDKTGLTGKYDITLKWTPDNTPADSPDGDGPSVFTAVQEQLGLRLESTKGPVTTLVIDHIEKPTDN
jgi:uncharacterized protein (TIGR03435 family)